MPISLVVLLAKLALSVGEPLRVLERDLFHRVVHKFLTKKLPHHPVNDVLVILLLAHLLELPHHLAHYILPHLLDLLRLHPFEVSTGLTKVVKELVNGSVTCGCVLVLYILELLSQIILHRVYPLLRPAQALERVLQNVPINRVLQVVDQLVHVLLGVEPTLIRHVLVDAVVVLAGLRVAKVNLTILLLLTRHPPLHRSSQLLVFQLVKRGV
mmetsp:Transcript_17992/g.37439  ORF Transcript_17992/g.37439 Transcript_17992/m.37439 type:complete len:212 (+) Transcript_17992:306-941(+)